MENTLFNVRGVAPRYTHDKDYLLDTLKLGFMATDNQYAKAYRIDKDKGLILYWSTSTERGNKVEKFITPLTPEELYPQVKAFLKSYYDGEINMELEEFDENMEEDDDDLTSIQGWRVYTEKWGRVGGDTYAFLAIKPAWETFGK